MLACAGEAAESRAVGHSPRFLVVRTLKRSTGDPIEGAGAKLIKLRTGRWTDAAGMARFDGPLPDTLLVRAEAKGFVAIDSIFAFAGHSDTLVLSLVRDTINHNPRDDFYPSPLVRKPTKKPAGQLSKP